MMKGPISSDSRAPPSGLKGIPSEGMAEETVAQRNLARTLQPETDTYRLSERALHQLVHSSRLLCKSSWAYVRKT